MNDFEHSLHQLKKIQPDKHWVHQAKQNILHQLELGQDEALVKTWFKKSHPVQPSENFLQFSRMRLMHQIRVQKSIVKGSFAGLRRLLASTLILVLAGLSTLLFSEGKTTVVADETAILEVLWGQVTLQEDLRWEKVAGRKEVESGDLFRTGEVDAVLHFKENQLRLGPNTVLLISQLNSTREVRFNVSQGSVWLQVPSQKKEKMVVAIETPNANILTPNGSVFVQAEPLGSSTSIKVFSGVARVTHSSFMDQKTKVEVMTVGEKLNLYGKKPSEGVLAFDLEKAQKNSDVVRNLHRDHEHEKHLEEVDLNRLKRSLSQ